MYLEFLLWNLLLASSQEESMVQSFSIKDSSPSTLSSLLLASFVFLGGGRGVGHFSLEQGEQCGLGKLLCYYSLLLHVYYTHSSSFCSLEAKTLKAKKLINESFCVVCCLWSHPFPEAVMLTKSLGKGLQG